MQVSTEDQRAKEVEHDLNIVLSYLEHRNFLDEDRAKKLKSVVLGRKDKLNPPPPLAATTPSVWPLMTICSNCNVKYRVASPRSRCPNCGHSVFGLKSSREERLDIAGPVSLLIGIVIGVEWIAFRVLNMDITGLIAMTLIGFFCTASVVVYIHFKKVRSY